MSINKLSKMNLFIVLIITFTVTFLAILTYQFKKQDQNSKQNNQSPLIESQNQQQASQPNKEINKHIEVTATQTKKDQQSTNEPLFDTKSDESIQPIDPEKDPGNQIN